MINIIDGFFLGKSTPIDSRFVVADSTERINIFHKYDGLRVFQISDRTTWIWNATTPPTGSWEQEISGNVGGTGTLNYVSKWITSNTLGNSSIFATGSFVGVNNTDPKSVLQLKNGSLQPLSLHIRNNGSIELSSISYNYYFDSTAQRFDSGKNSSYIEMASNSSFKFLSRVPSSSTWTSFFELNNENGYNFLRGSTNGTFISGSASFGTSTTPNITNQLMFVNGSFRTNNSIYGMVSTIVKITTFSYQKRNGFSLTQTIPTPSTILNSTYQLQSEDSEILCFNTHSSQFRIELSDIGLDTNQIGRKIKISNCNTTTATSPSIFIDKAINNDLIDGINTTQTTIILSPGDTIELISCWSSTGTRIWKVINFIRFGLNNISALNGDFLFYTGGNWIRRNFLQHLESNANLGTNTGTYLKLTTGTKELSLSGDNNSLLKVSHSNFGQMILEPKSGGTFSSTMYIISTNNLTTTGSQFDLGLVYERIKIQTGNLTPAISGSSDPYSPPGSIQIASKTSINFISQTGKYYLGDKINSGASNAVLPSIGALGGNIKPLYIDISTGEILRGA
jgi:hypothetical protein